MANSIKEVDLPKLFLEGIPGRKPEEKVRISKDEYFMEIAHVVSKRSTCHRHNVGAVLVKDKHIVSTGYNGAAAGMKDCLELGCLRDQLGIPSGERHEICRAIHAEQNTVIQAALHGKTTEGATLFCTINPCIICAKILVNAKIKRVVYEGTYPDNTGVNFLKAAGVDVQNFSTDRLDRYVTKKF
jgi:dCMP deaminase